MPVIPLRPFDISVQWLTPEADSTEVVVDLASRRSPTGAAIVFWEVDPDNDPAEFRAAWSAEPRSAATPLPSSVRLRVTRHDGPRRVGVRITDENGGCWSTSCTTAPRPW